MKLFTQAPQRIQTASEKERKGGGKVFSERGKASLKAGGGGWGGGKKKGVAGVYLFQQAS